MSNARGLLSRVARLEQQCGIDKLIVTIRRFAGGALVGYSGSSGTVRRIAGETDEALEDRAAKSMARHQSGVVVMVEVRE